MGRHIGVRPPSAAEVRQLERWLDDSLLPVQERRVKSILLHGAGVSAAEIARNVAAHVNTIYTDLHRFDQVGLSSVHHQGTRGAPRRISEATVKTICRMADCPPAEQGLVFGRWSLRLLREHLTREHIVSRISREHLRRLIKKGASATGKSGAS